MFLFSQDGQMIKMDITYRDMIFILLGVAIGITIMLIWYYVYLTLILNSISVLYIM